jgi:hypothetical protein
MLHEKIFKREDGSRVKIEVVVTITWSRSEKPVYRYLVRLCEPKKRTWKPVENFGYNYKWRAMSIPDRGKYQIKKYLEHVTKEEMLETALEAWELMKPTDLLEADI